MHKDIVKMIVESVRLRVAQGDCPTEPARSTEDLESVILEQVSALEGLRKERDIWMQLSSDYKKDLSEAQRELESVKRELEEVKATRDFAARSRDRADDQIDQLYKDKSDLEAKLKLAVECATKYDRMFETIQAQLFIRPEWMEARHRQQMNDILDGARETLSKLREGGK